MTKVLILGGGVAGLTAAQELVKRGFTVEVHEQNDVVGGKARSMGKPGSGTGGRHDLPGEHGFRFFPGFYKHVIDSMQNIPVVAPPGKVSANLVATTQVGIARNGMPLFRLPVQRPESVAQWIAALREWFGDPALGVPREEVAFFAGKLLQFMSSCNDRRLGEYETLEWWKFVDADNKSPAYRKLLATGLTRSLVAMRPEVASTRTIATILCQMLFTLGDESGNALDRVLNAPTTAAWIDHWRDFLVAQGVTFVQNSTVEGLTYQAGKITSATVRPAGGASVGVTADYFVCALPKEVTQNLVTPAIAQAAPSLAHLDDLKTDWMNGIQFFLNRNVPITNGHIILADAPWALTALSQPQFWAGVNLGQYGDGTTAGIISVDISEWDVAGAHVGLPAKQCTQVQIRDEVWAQLKSHFSFANLQDADRIDHFLDPAIVIGNPTTNKEPLFINTVGSWPRRPAAKTGIPNLMVASDYVQTHTDLATMEGANEAARRAVNEILRATGSTAPACGVWPMKEPAMFDVLKEMDQILWNHHLPHPGIEALQSPLAAA